MECLSSNQKCRKISFFVLFPPEWSCVLLVPGEIFHPPSPLKYLIYPLPAFLTLWCQITQCQVKRLGLRSAQTRLDTEPSQRSRVARVWPAAWGHVPATTRSPSHTTALSIHPQRGRPRIHSFHTNERAACSPTAAPRRVHQHLRCSLTHRHCHTHRCSLTHRHGHTRSCSLPRSLAHTHARTHSRTHPRSAHTLTHTHRREAGPAAGQAEAG